VPAMRWLELPGFTTGREFFSVRILVVGRTDKLDQLLFLDGVLGFLFGRSFLLPLALPTLLFQGEAGGLVIVAAQEGQFAVELAETIPAFPGRGILFEEFGGQAVELGGENGGETVGEAVTVGDVVEVGGGFGEVEGSLAGLLAAAPGDVAGMVCFLSITRASLPCAGKGCDG